MNRSLSITESSVNMSDEESIKAYISAKLHSKEYSKIHNVGDQMVLRDPNCPRGWCLKGISYCFKKEFTHAISCLSKSQGLGPERLLPSVYLARVKLMRARHLSALEGLEALSVNERALSRLESFGLEEVGNILEEIFDWARMAISGTGSTDPEKPSEVALRVIGLLRSFKLFEQGKKCAHVLTSTDPGNDQYQTECILLEIECKDPGVESKVEALVEKQPGNANAWFCKGVLMSRLFRKEAALECFDKCLSIEPDNAKFVLHRAETFREVGLMEEFSNDVALGSTIMKKRKVVGATRERRVAERICLYEEVNLEYSKMHEDVKRSVRSNLDRGGFESTGQMLETRQKAEYLHQLIEKQTSGKKAAQVRRLLNIERTWMERNEVLFGERNVLRERDKEAKVEEYKKIFMRCFQLLDNTIMRYLSNDYNLKKSKVKSVLSFIPLPWYIFKPLKGLIKYCVWQGNRNKIDNEIRKYYDFFSASILGDGAFILDKIANDFQFRMRIEAAGSNPKVREFREENFVLRVRSSLENNILRFLRSDQEILAFIDFELIKGLVLSGVVGAKDGDYDARMERLFYYMKNPMMADLRALEDSRQKGGDRVAKYQDDEVMRYIIEHTDFGDNLKISAVSYTSFAFYSRIGNDLVRVSIPKARRGPETVSFEYKGRVTTKKLKEKIELAAEVKEIEVSIRVEGFVTLSAERKAFFYVEDLKKGQMNFREIFGESDNGRWVMVGKLGIFVD